MGDVNITYGNILPNSSTDGNRIKLEFNANIASPPQILSLRHEIDIMNIWLS